MRIYVSKDYEEMSKKAANIVAAQIYLRPNSVIGLATGSTPLLMYQELVRLHKEEGLDFSEVVTFNLDEYIGLPERDVNSYHYYMHNQFFNHINIRRDNIHIPNGMASNIDKECVDYERLIMVQGGIDLQVLGIGKNGHIGFNEPDVKFETATHRVKLDEETINANARFFQCIEQVPQYAISMGIKTIMHAKKVLLLANGSAKAEAVFKSVYGGITPETPASILQLHQDVTMVLDEGGAQMLGRSLANYNIDNALNRLQAQA